MLLGYERTGLPADISDSEWVENRLSGVLTAVKMVQKFIKDKEHMVLTDQQKAATKEKSDHVPALAKRYAILKRPVPTAEELQALHSVEPINVYVAKTKPKGGKKTKRAERKTEESHKKAKRSVA